MLSGGCCAAQVMLHHPRQPGRWQQGGVGRGAAGTGAQLQAQGCSSAGGAGRVPPPPFPSMKENQPPCPSDNIILFIFL